MQNAAKISRNAPCPCGSGKKFKACCADRPGSVSAIPLDIEPLHRQARQAVAAGNFTEAERCFRQLAHAKPADAYFKAGLGQALCWLHRRKEGISCLLQAARLLERQAAKSRDPRFLVELSAQLTHWGEVNAAERLARLALTLAPKSPVFLNNLALCLVRMNRHQEALPVSRQVCQLLPDHPGCNILLAILEARFAAPEQALDRLNRVIERNDDREQTARAWLEKAVILDKIGRYDEAFAAMVRAGREHSALSPLGPEQRESLFETLESNSQGFNAALLKRWPVEDVINDGLPAPAFLLGFLRSGTTLTEQVLGAHSRIIATDESSVIHELTRELQRLSGSNEDHAKALSALNLAQIKQLRQFYWRRMREEYGDAVMVRQLVDKNALNTIELGVISVVFPEAKILFALRDPRDVCLSCFMQAFSSSPATVNLTSWQGIARQYAGVMGYWLTLRETMQPRYLEVRYEDTVNDFESTFRQIFAFLGVEWQASVLKFHERARGRYISTPSFAAVSQPLYNTALRRWTHYAKHYVEIEGILEPYIDALGYVEPRVKTGTREDLHSMR